MGHNHYSKGGCSALNSVLKGLPKLSLSFWLILVAVNLISLCAPL